MTEGGQSTYEDRQTYCINEAKLKYFMERLEDIGDFKSGHSIYEERQTHCINAVKLKYSMERLEGISRVMATLKLMWEGGGSPT